MLVRFKRFIKQKIGNLLGRIKLASFLPIQRYLFPWAWWPEKPNGGYSLAEMTLIVKELTGFLTTAIDSSLALVLLSKSSKSLDHMLRKEYTVYCFEILWIGHMLRYHTDGFSESPTTVSLLLCWSVRYRLTVYVERVYKRKEPCGSIQYQKSYGRLSYDLSWHWCG